MSSSTPLPSRVYFITQLQHLDPGDKVRFIGWSVISISEDKQTSDMTSSVNNYSEKTAILELFHNFPQARNAAKSTVHLDITDLLESLRREDLEVGAWVNVVGSIQASANPSTATGRNGLQEIPKVKAVMLWSAGSINMGEYEKALTERQAV